MKLENVYIELTGHLKGVILQLKHVIDHTICPLRFPERVSDATIQWVPSLRKEVGLKKKHERNQCIQGNFCSFFTQQSVCIRKCIQVATTNSFRKKSFRRASEVMLCSKSKNCRLLRQFCRWRCRCIMKMFVGKENSVIESRLCAPGLILSLVCAFQLGVLHQKKE